MNVWKSCAIGVLVMTGLVHNARASVTFSVAGVSTVTTGTSPSVALGGSFTTNDALSSLISFDITAPASGAFTGFEYTTANSTISSVLPAQYFRLDSGSNELQFYFTSGLTSTGGALLVTNSFDHENSGGNRLLSGTVTAAVTPPTTTPEPLSAATLGAGLAAMVVTAGGLGRKRRA